MKCSFATLGCPDWTPEETVKNALDMGFDGVELRVAPGDHVEPDASATVRQQVRQLFQEAGLDIACLMGYAKFTANESSVREENVDLALALIGLAADLKCPTVRVFGGAWSGIRQSDAVKRLTDALNAIAPEAERNGVRIAVETHDDWCRGEILAAVLDAVDSPTIGACWDVANAYFIEPMETTFEALRKRLVHVHFKDAKAAADGEQPCLPGNGDVDLKKALDLLSAAGYDGYLSFEWEKKWHPELAPPEDAFPHYLKTVKRLMA